MKLRTLGAMLLATSACTGIIGDGADDHDSRPGAAAPVDATPPPNVDDVAKSGMRRLTQREYDNSVRDLVGDDTGRGEVRLPTDARSPFDNVYTTQTVSPALVSGAELAAMEVSARLMSNAAQRDRVLGCVPSGPADEPCLRSFIVRFGRRALRRALSDQDVEHFMKARQTSIDEGDFYAGMDVVVRAFLQDPQFLYRFEIGSPVSGHPELVRLDDWEVATRISFLLWGSGPDDRLLDRAAAGQLRSTEQVRAAAAELLADPKTQGVIERFHAMWMGFERLPFEPALGAAMQAETAALLQRVIFTEKRPWQDIFRLEETLVPDSLAAHYGLPLHGSEEPAWTSYSGTGRRGLLSQGSFLSVGARGNDTSPTLRGKAVRTRLLCQFIAPPPPNVKADEPPAATSPCKQARYKEHAANAACASCHSLMDPIGFGLEGYDSQGRFRVKEDTEADCPIDGKGEVVHVGAFSGPGELSSVLLQTGDLNMCVATQLYRFALGHADLEPADTRLVNALIAKRPASDFRLDDLLLDIVASPSFAYRRVEE